MLDKERVSGVEQAIEPFAVPKEPNVYSCVEDSRDPFDRDHGYSIGMTSLDAPDHGSGQSDPFGNVFLS